MRVRQLETDIYLFTGEAYDSNSTALLSGNEALLVDGMASTADAQALKRVVEDDLGKTVRWIVSTHYFSDHMAALQLFPKCQVLAHAAYAHTFASERYRTPEEMTYFAEPDVQISGPLRMKWGRYTLDIFPNTGHTMSTINIDVPEANLLFSADNAVGNMVYLYYSAPELLARALEELERRKRGRIVEGHGEVRNSHSFDNARHYLRTLLSRARAATSEDGIRQIALDDCLPAGVKGTDFEMIFHKRNLESVIERKLYV